VVVDPKLADAIMTERIDAPFLKAIDELVASRGEQPAKTETAAESSPVAAGSVEDGLQAPRPTNRPLGQPSGTVFLVHKASRNVLWSTFVNTQDSTPMKLHGQAKDIAGRLKKEAVPRE
jgi:hypothetical protein